MKLKSISVIAAGMVLVADIASAGDITGTVTLSGTPPAEKAITPLKDDAICGKFYTDTPTTHFFNVGPNKELADVVVIVKDITGKAADASAPAVVLDQKNCLYSPQIVAIQTGQKLLVRNSDPQPVAMHNVHVNPAVPANLDKANSSGTLNVAQMAGAPDVTMAFPAAENFMKFQCDVHPWMFAWVTVVDSPYFAVTDKDGKFTIKNVPPGKHTIVAYHRKAAPAGISKDLEVAADGAKVDFTVEVK